MKRNRHYYICRTV